MLGLSTATLGWSRCLQRTQSLFFIFSFFPFFSPVNLSIGCGGGRRISKPLSSAGCSMHHCCNAVLEMVTELECLCPPFSHPGLAEAVQEHQAHGLFVLLASQTGGWCCLDGCWKSWLPRGAGRDPAELHPGSISRSPRLTRRCLDMELQAAHRAAGEGLGSLFRLPLDSVCPRNRCLHPHEPAAAMQVQTTGVFCVLTWASQELLQPESIT